MAQNIMRIDPLLAIDTLRRDLFDDGLFRTLRSKLPATDVYTEDDKTLVIEAHLPNFEEKDISVSVDHGTLVIQAERHEKEEDKKKKYVLRESTTSFHRTVTLPDSTEEKAITASFEGGVLKVSVPLTGVSAPREIAIGAGG